jgi:hypothetical protein
MFNLKPIKSHKGYILVYTMIVALICILVVMLGMKILLDESENLKFFHKYVSVEKNEKKYKEYLLTYLGEYINKNIAQLSNDSIKDYFKLNSDTAISSFEKSYIKYNVSQDCFILIYKYENDVLKEDQYKYNVINNLLKYTYIGSIYVKERS